MKQTIQGIHNQSDNANDSSHLRKIEQNILYQMGMAGNDPNLPLSEKLALFSNLLPGACTFSDICKIAIRYDELVVTTPGYQKTPWTMTETFTTTEGKTGEIEVGYLQNRAISEAEKAVCEGNQALSDTVSSFTILSSAVEEISTSMESVAAATQQQAASFEEISANITDMSSQVKETAVDAMHSSATSEEALAVVEQITGVITEINEVVSRYPVR